MNKDKRITKSFQTLKQEALLVVLAKQTFEKVQLIKSNKWHKQAKIKVLKLQVRINPCWLLVHMFSSLGMLGIRHK